MTELPYIYRPPESVETPLVVSVPHAGERVDDEDAPLLIASERTRRMDADLHVDRLYQNAPSLGAAFLAATVSRYVLDLNRGPGDVDAEVCPTHPAPIPANPRALIWRLSTGGDAVQARGLTMAELQSRIDRIHRPYHKRLSALLNDRVERFGYAILLDAHSMPSVGRVTHADTGQRRADIVPGDNRGKSCEAALRELVMSHFSEQGFSVALNKPYSGGWITRNYGRPADGVHAIQVELNRSLYLDEEVPAWNAASAGRLQVVLDALVRRLATYRPVSG